MFTWNSHEYIERDTPEENGDIESLYTSIKTDYICIIEINNFSDGKVIIENAFYELQQYTAIFYPWSLSTFVVPGQIKQ